MGDSTTSRMDDARIPSLDRARRDSPMPTGMGFATGHSSVPCAPCARARGINHLAGRLPGARAVLDVDRPGLAPFAALERSPLFAGLEPEALSEIAAVMEPLSAPATSSAAWASEQSGSM